MMITYFFYLVRELEYTIFINTAYIQCSRKHNPAAMQRNKNR